MKIYISGSITNDKKWKKHFNSAEKEIYKRFGKDTVVFNPTLTAKYDGKISYDDFMHLDYAQIDICDAIYLMKTWVDSSGAKLEKAYAEKLGKQIFYQ